MCIHSHTHTKCALCALWVLGYPLTGRVGAKLDLSFPDILFWANIPCFIKYDTLAWKGDPTRKRGRESSELQTHMLVLEMPRWLAPICLSKLDSCPESPHRAVRRIKTDLAPSPSLPSATGGREMMFSEIPSNMDVLQVYDYEPKICKTDIGSFIHIKRNRAFSSTIQLLGIYPEEII